MLADLWRTYTATSIKRDTIMRTRRKTQKGGLNWKILVRYLPQRSCRSRSRCSPPLNRKWTWSGKQKNMKTTTINTSTAYTILPFGGDWNQFEHACSRIAGFSQITISGSNDRTTLLWFAASDPIHTSFLSGFPCRKSSIELYFFSLGVGTVTKLILLLLLLLLLVKYW